MDNARHDDNATPLFMASQNGRTDCVQLLLAANAMFIASWIVFLAEPVRYSFDVNNEHFVDMFAVRGAARRMARGAGPA